MPRERGAESGSSAHSSDDMPRGRGAESGRSAHSIEDTLREKLAKALENLNGRNKAEVTPHGVVDAATDEVGECEHSSDDLVRERDTESHTHPHGSDDMPQERGAKSHIPANSSKDTLLDLLSEALESFNRRKKKEVKPRATVDAATGDGGVSDRNSDGMPRRRGAESRRPTHTSDSMSMEKDFEELFNLMAMAQSLKDDVEPIHTIHTKALVVAVSEGDEVTLRQALARGGDPQVTIPTVLGGSWCLVAVASRHGHGHLLSCLLEEGLSVEGRGSDDQTPLMLAAGHGHKRMVEALLARGADPLAGDEDGWTALHQAAAHGRAECVSTLIPVTPPSPEMLQAADAHTPVHLASFRGHLEVVKALEEAGWPLYSLDSAGLTPLHLAMKEGRLDVVKYLISKDVQPSTRESDGFTLQDFAVKHSKDLAKRWLARKSGAGHMDAAQSLKLKGTPSAMMDAATGDGEVCDHNSDDMPRGRGAESRRSAHTSENMPRKEDFKELLGNMGEFFEDTMGTIHTMALVIAVRDGDEVRVRDALARGGDPQETVPTILGGSWCLVAVAARHGHDHLLPCLLEAGLSVEGRGSDDQTPLMLAAGHGHKRTVEALLALGADPLAGDNTGWTALHRAAVHGEAECVSTLIPVIPPSPEVLQAANAHTPVHLASFRGHVGVVKALEESGWPLYTLDSAGLTPLHWAVRGERLQMVKYLLNKEVQPTTTDSWEDTLQDLAVKNSKDLAKRWLERKNSAGQKDGAQSPKLKGTPSAGADAATGDGGVCDHNSDDMPRGGGTESRRPAHTSDNMPWDDDFEELLDNMGQPFRDVMSPLHTMGLLAAVTTGDEVTVRHALARGGDPEVTVPTVTDGSGCLVALAASSGHGHLLPCLLEAGLSVEGRGNIDQTPLMLAALRGNKGTVEALLERGADPLARDKAGWTALHWAALDNEVDCVSTLIPVTPPSHEVLRSADAHTPVHLASFGGHVRVVKTLEEAGWPLYTLDSAGLTPLHWAVKGGRLDMVKYLLPKDVQPSTKESGGFTPQDLAVKKAKDSAARWLARKTGAVHVDADHGQQFQETPIAGVNVGAGDDTLLAEDLSKLLGFRGWLVEKFNKKALVTAVEEGDVVRVRDALARGADPEMTVPTDVGGSWCLVAVASRQGRGHLLPCLLEAGLSVEGRGSDDETPLMLAAKHGHKRTVETLLALGADPLARDNRGTTALHFAAARNRKECVSAIMACNPFDTQDGCGGSSLHGAAEGGSLETDHHLTTEGVKPSKVKNKDGLTVQDMAVMYGSHLVEELLLKKGAAVPMDAAHCLRLMRYRRSQNEASHSRTVSWVEDGEAALLTANIPEAIDGHLLDEHGLTSLHRAAQRGLSAECVSALLQQGVSPHVLTPGRLTPADLARRAGHEEVLKVLLQHQCEKTTVSPEELHAELLHIIANRDDAKAVSKLLCKGVPLEPVGSCSKSALRLAVILDRCRTVSLMLASGAMLPVSLLQDAWKSPDVSSGVLAALTSTYLCRLQEERNRVKERASLCSTMQSTEQRRVDALLKAIDVLLNAIEEDATWQAALPKEKQQALSALMVEPALTNCPDYLCRLREERRRVEERGRLYSTMLSEDRRRVIDLLEGIDFLLKAIEGDAPWRAAWPEGKPQALSALMAEAVLTNCPVSVAFLHRAGAWSFLGGKWGASPLAASLEAGHKHMTELLVRDLGGCIYLTGADGRLLRDMIPEAERRQMEQNQLHREREVLEDWAIRQKSKLGKETADRALKMQEELYDSYVAHRPQESLPTAGGRSVLQLSVRKGLVQLTYLVVQVGRLPVDEMLDDICHTTALHEAASHGQVTCVELLLCAGADPLRCDRYGQTPRLLAAMFGHKRTEQLLALREPQDLPCRAGTTAEQASSNYDAYLRRYERVGLAGRKALTPVDRHDPERVTCKLLGAIGVQELWQKAKEAVVDFSRGEALEVKNAVMEELQAIVDKVAQKDSLYGGELKLVGSSYDQSKIYSPDEFDVNLVVTSKNGKVEVEKTPEVFAKQKGKLEMSVVTSEPGLQKEKFMENLFLLVQKCLAEYKLQDKRLSLVPPGLSMTQVGAALALAWQGREYRLLLIGVDLVPVLELPWNEKIIKPELIGDNDKSFHVSNTSDGCWRCSFALTEAMVLKNLPHIKRLVFVMGKVLLSCLKAEPWMPQDMKSHCTWFANREWKIVAPSGFCFKNAFLRWLEKLGDEELVAEKEEAHFCAKALIAVCRQLCAEPNVMRGHLTPANISAYFGGDFEGVKVGEGAQLIVRCLEENLEEEQKETAGRKRKGSKSKWKNVSE